MYHGQGCYGCEVGENLKQKIRKIKTYFWENQTKNVFLHKSERAISFQTNSTYVNLPF